VQPRTDPAYVRAGVCADLAARRHLRRHHCGVQVWRRPGGPAVHRPSVASGRPYYPLHLHPPAAGRADQRIDCEHAPQKLAPGDAVARRNVRATPRIARPIRSRCSLLARHHVAPPHRAGCQDPVIANLVCPWRRYLRGQPREQHARLHNQRTRAVPPAVTQAVQKPAVRQLLESVRGERWPAHVSAQPFQPGSVSSGHRHAGVQAEAAQYRAAKLRLLAEVGVRSILMADAN
jgi:hypothetical protein